MLAGFQCFIEHFDPYHQAAVKAFFYGKNLMPRKTIAYGCEHGCGRKVLTSLISMAKHEKTCFRNPERKACKTCAHFESFCDSNGMESEPNYLHEFIVSVCSADEDIDLTEKLRADCPLWSKK